MLFIMLLEFAVLVAFLRLEFPEFAMLLTMLDDGWRTVFGMIDRALLRFPEFAMLTTLGDGWRTVFGMVERALLRFLEFLEFPEFAMLTTLGDGWRTVFGMVERACS